MTKKKQKKSKEAEFRGLYFLVGLFSVLSIAAICLVLVLGWQSWKKENPVKEEAVTTRTQARAVIREEGEENSTQEKIEESSAAQETETEEESDILNNLDQVEAGEILTREQLDWEHLGDYFTSSEISEEVYERINGISFKESGVVPREDLRYLKVLHYGFDHEIHVGELIVNAGLAEEFVEIFTELFEEEYEIEKMYLIDRYGADDYTSIEDNNTSCFNYREVTGGSSLSNHATGCAIDINPQQNPYVTFSNGLPVWSHSNADDYIDREGGAEHMITHTDICYQIFHDHGFTWGGDWNSLKDYQHFEKVVGSY